jgi:hypothetical protein
MDAWMEALESSLLAREVDGDEWYAWTRRVAAGQIKAGSVLCY